MHATATDCTAPEILAISAESRSGIKEKLRQLLASSLLHKTPAAEIYRGLRQKFNHEAGCRLLATIDTTTGIDRVLSASLSYLEGSSRVNGGGNNIFFKNRGQRNKIGFLFPGQGSQYLHMGADLLHAFPETRAAFAQAEKALGVEGLLEAAIFPKPAKNREEKSSQEARLRQTEMAQPAIGTISVVMLEALKRFALFPDAVCGHSYGELTALYASGRLQQKTFFDLSVARGRYMAAAARAGDTGRMMAIKAPIREITELISDQGLDVTLANINSPEQGVVSGPTEEMEKLQAVCREKKVRAVFLPVSAAFHSRLVESAARPFAKKLETITFHSSPIPVYANTTGRAYPADAEPARDLLARHLLCPVRFADAVEAMYKDGIATFIEVGPKPVLTGLVRAIFKSSDHTAVALDGGGGKSPFLLDLARALCHIAATGHFVDLKKWPPAPLSG